MNRPGDSGSLRLWIDAKRAADRLSCRCRSGRMRWHRRLGSTTEARTSGAVCDLYGQASLLCGRGSTRPASSLDLGHGTCSPGGTPLPRGRPHRLGALAPLRPDRTRLYAFASSLPLPLLAVQRLEELGQLSNLGTAELERRRFRHPALQSSAAPLPLAWKAAVPPRRYGTCLSFPGPPFSLSLPLPPFRV